MPDSPKLPRLEIKAETAAEFDKALGSALAQWQHIEAALYTLAHCLMEAPHEVSSIAFFHVKSAESRIGLVDKLCEHRLAQETYQQKWVPVRKQVAHLIEVRNAIAHFEMAWLDADFAKGKTKFPIIISSHHLDVHANRHGAKTLYIENLWQADHGFHECAKLIWEFVVGSVPHWRQRAALLPPNLLLVLDSVHRTVSQREQPPPPLSPQGQS